MNNSFGIWLIGAGVVAAALLLLIGPSLVEPEAPSELELAESVDVGSTYWRPVVEETAVAQVVYESASSSSVVTTGPSAPCPSCGTTQAVSATPAPALAGGCGYPSTPCGKPACPVCRSWKPPAAAVSFVSPPSPGVSLAGGCGHPSVACGSTPCAPLTWGCYDVCTDPCRVVKPGINRNMPLCVDECSFIQLRSTVSHPICEQVWFEWSASKGWFLDPSASDPLYFAPTTPFCDGEDVWITLVITDASGTQYSDVVTLRVRDLP